MRTRALFVKEREGRDMNQLVEQGIKTLNSAIPRIKDSLAIINKVEDDVDRLALSPDEILHYDMLRSFEGTLSKVVRGLEYLSRPIVLEGRLHKNKIGRYAIDDDHYYTSGSPIEVLVHDKYDDVKKWVLTRVEHGDGDYYLVDYKEVPMQGLKVRVRG